MIVPMLRVRMLGPRERLQATLEALQDAGVVHLSETHLAEGLQPIQLSARQAREVRHLSAMAREMDQVLQLAPNGGSPPPGVAADDDFAGWARLAHNVRRELERIDASLHALEDERVELVRLIQFVTGMANIREVIPFPRTPGSAPC